MRVLSAIWGGLLRVLEPIGRVVTVILLTAIYLAIVLPVSLVVRLTGTAPLCLRSGGESTWRAYQADYSRGERAREPF